MKSLICLLLCSISLTMLNAQSNSIKHLFDSVPESEDILRVELSGFFLNFLTSDDDGDKKDHGIKAIRLLGADDYSLIPKASIANLQKGLRAERFEPLTEIRSDGDHIQLLIKEKKDTITEFVALIKGQEGVFVISIEGAFKWDDLKDIDMEIEGLDQLKKIPDDVPRA